MLDVCHPYETIGAVGREDRALLRNNPSAGPMPENRLGCMSCHIPLSSSLFFGLKAKNLLVWDEGPNKAKNHQNAPTGRTYVTIYGGRLYNHHEHK